MKKQTRKLFFLAFSAVLIVSCSEELEIVNPNQLSVDSYYNTQTDAKNAVDAIYSSMMTDGWYQRMTPAINDSRSDEIRSRSPWVFLSQTANFTVPATDAAVGWAMNDYYQSIFRANQALEQIPLIEDVDAGFRDRLMGQAYFLRGLAYFNLTNIFDNVPLVLTVAQGQEDYFPSNEGISQADVYAQVELDWTEAVAKLPVNYDNVIGPDAGQVGRATKGAAQSLMGKLKLYQGDYSGAITIF